MGTLAALLPPVAVCAAFVAILIAVKRHANREEAEDRALRAAERDPGPAQPAAGPRVHMVPVEDEPGPAEKKSRPSE